MNTSDPSLIISQPIEAGVTNHFIVFATQFALMRDFGFKPVMNSHQLDTLSGMFDTRNLKLLAGEHNGKEVLRIWKTGR